MTIDWTHTPAQTPIGKFLHQIAAHRTALWVPDLGSSVILSSGQDTTSGSGNYTWGVCRTPDRDEYFSVDFCPDSPYGLIGDDDESLGGTRWAALEPGEWQRVKPDDWPSLIVHRAGFVLPDAPHVPELRHPAGQDDLTVWRYPDDTLILEATGPAGGEFGGRDAAGQICRRGTLYVELLEADLAALRPLAGQHEQTSMEF